MQISHKNGFTLIELLVVIVLLGIVTSLAVLSMGASGAERKMEEEAKRLHALIKLVREEAIIQAKEIAMEINKQEYLFLEYKEKKWIPLNNKIFQARTINEELDFRVETETELKLVETKKENLLRLYFLSSGEQTPFEIRLNTKDNPQNYYRLLGLFNGELKLEHINTYEN
ncbi:MAG: type II secretion system minor pseudopilin GspH [Gammaproteobacteria bacterium]|nr:type II secretion system minor pseudopilin GspH [Gammaproteobacteria bacterium]MCW9029903.1 type II secretion system minor pseudopilin GspH [Gammaproteobacteria bacterium]